MGSKDRTYTERGGKVETGCTLEELGDKRYFIETELSSVREEVYLGH